MAFFHQFPVVGFSGAYVPLKSLIARLKAQNHGLFSPVPSGRILRGLLERMGPLKEFDCTFESTKLWPFFTSCRILRSLLERMGPLEEFDCTFESTKLWPFSPISGQNPGLDWRDSQKILGRFEKFKENIGVDWRNSQKVLGWIDEASKKILK